MHWKPARTLSVALLLLPLALFAEQSVVDTELALAEAWQRYDRHIENQNWTAALDEMAAMVDHASFGLPAGDERVPALVLSYATLLDYLNHDELADAAFLDAREAYIETFGSNSIEMVPLIMAEGDRIGGKYRARDQKSKYREALVIVERAHGRQSLDYAELSLDAGLRILDLSRTDDGLSYVRNGLSAYKKLLGPNDPRTAEAHIGMARIYIGKGKYSLAAGYLEDALQGFDPGTEEGRERAIQTHRYPIRTYEVSGKGSKSDRHIDALIELMTDGTNSEPIIAARFSPEYPEHLGEQGKQGSVTMRFKVDLDGTVTDPVVVEVTGDDEFVAPAREAILRYRYLPALVDGARVVADDMSATIVFDIERFQSPRSRNRGEPRWHAPRGQPRPKIPQT